MSNHPRLIVAHALWMTGQPPQEMPDSRHFDLIEKFSFHYPCKP
jgi:hypothetical protein